MNHYGLTAIAAGVALCTAGSTFAALTTSAVGVYGGTGDNPNTVDRVASETPVNAGRIILTQAGFEQFTVDVAEAFTAGTGGVADWEEPRQSRRSAQFLVDYAGQTRQLQIDVASGEEVVRVGGHSQTVALSGDRMLFPEGGSQLDLSFAANPLQQFGFTVLGRNSRTGTYTVTATFSDGQTASVATTYTQPTGEDTFFGFIAPEGVGIVGITTAGVTHMPTDDLGFIVVPEPASAAFAAMAGLLLMHRRRR